MTTTALSSRRQQLEEDLSRVRGGDRLMPYVAWNFEAATDQDIGNLARALRGNTEVTKLGLSGIEGVRDCTWAQLESVLPQCAVEYVGMMGTGASEERCAAVAALAAANREAREAREGGGDDDGDGLGSDSTEELTPEEAAAMSRALGERIIVQRGGVSSGMMGAAAAATRASGSGPKRPRQEVGYSELEEDEHVGRGGHRRRAAASPRRSIGQGACGGGGGGGDRPCAVGAGGVAASTAAAGSSRITGDRAPAGGSFATRSIGGVGVAFPSGLKPHPPQLALMAKVVAALRNGKHALLEAPTGTGKSLALLSAACAWQEAMRSQLPAAEPQTHVSSSAAAGAGLPVDAGKDWGAILLVDARFHSSSEGARTNRSQLSRWLWGSVREGLHPADSVRALAAFYAELRDQPPPGALCTVLNAAGDALLPPPRHQAAAAAAAPPLLSRDDRSAAQQGPPAPANSGRRHEPPSSYATGANFGYGDGAGEGVRGGMDAFFVRHSSPALTANSALPPLSITIGGGDSGDDTEDFHEDEDYGHKIDYQLSPLDDTDAAARRVTMPYDPAEDDPSEGHNPAIRLTNVEAEGGGDEVATQHASAAAAAVACQPTLAYVDDDDDDDDDDGDGEWGDDDGDDGGTKTATIYEEGPLGLDLVDSDAAIVVRAVSGLAAKARLPQIVAGMTLQSWGDQRDGGTGHVVMPRTARQTQQQLSQHPRPLLLVLREPVAG